DNRQKKSPRPCDRGLLFNSRAGRSAADFDAPRRAAEATPARATTTGTSGRSGGDHLHPQRILRLVEGGGVGLAQGVHAAHFRARSGLGEARQLEDHPRAGVQLADADGQRRPLGRHLDLGASHHRGFTGRGELLALAAEDHRRLGRSARAAPRTGCTTESTETTGAGRRTARSGGRTSRRTGGAKSARATRARSGSGRRSAGSTGARACCARTTSAGRGTRASTRTGTTGPGAGAASAATAKATTATADVHATDVALAHRSAPGGLH